MYLHCTFVRNIADCRNLATVKSDLKKTPINTAFVALKGKLLVLGLLQSATKAGHMTYAALEHVT